MAAFTVAELAARVGGEVEGDGAIRVDGVAPLEDAGPGQLSFFSNKKYRRAFEASRAGAVVVEPGAGVPAGRTVLRAANAYLAFARISTLFHPPREALPEASPLAAIHPSARVHPSAQIMPLACVGPGAEIGARTIVYPGAQVGDASRVGQDCVVYHNVVIRERCVVGDRVILQPGCVIGSDGFGFAFDPQGEGQGPRHFKVPQIGNVVVEDDVEIGANTCVDRATLGSTRICRGAKIDNLVQIAHNVEIGSLSLIVAQVGIAGSTRLGMGVIVGGQASLVGHAEIGAGVRIAAQAGIQGDVSAGETLGGSPAQPHGKWLRNVTAFEHLAEMRKELRELRREGRHMNNDRTPPPPAAAGPVLDVEAIQRLLPHRPPFLLVDRVVSVEPGVKLVAWKGVTMNEPFFVGHFPGKPVMPGVLILEALAQACALLALVSLEVSDKLTYLMSIDGARFRRPVVPGDRLELHVEVLKRKSAIWRQKGTAMVDGQVVAEAEFLAMLADREPEPGR